MSVLLNFINFNSLQKVANIGVENRPTNIFKLMKKGYKHYIKVSDFNIFNPSKNIEAKETGKISKERPSKSFLYYFAYTEENTLTLFNADNDTPIETYNILSLIDIVFYQYDQEKESLIDFIKSQIKRQIELTLNNLISVSEKKSQAEEKEEKAVKPHLKRFNELLEEATEENIDTFIAFSNNNVLVHSFYLRAINSEKQLNLKEYLEGIIKELETTLTLEEQLQEKLKTNLTELAKSLNLNEEELKQYAESLANSLYSNIASKQYSGQAEIERITNLARAKKLAGKDLYIFNYLTYLTLVNESPIKNNIEMAKELLKELERGNLNAIISLFNAIFNPLEVAEIEVIDNDKMLQATDNIVSGLLAMRLNALKVINYTELELILKLQNEDKEAYIKNLTGVNKEDLKDIIAYKSIKIEYDLKKLELNNTKKELKEAKDKGTFGDTLTALNERVETLKQELKELSEEVYKRSEDIIPYNNDYYKNHATLNGLHTYINEEESGKIEVTLLNGTIKIFIQPKSAVKQSDLTFTILFLIFDKIAKNENKNNEIDFSIAEIHDFMIKQKELVILPYQSENQIRRNKAYAVEKFRENCEILKGFELAYTIFKQKGKPITEKKGGGYLVEHTDYTRKIGVKVFLNSYYYNNVMKENKGFLILPYNFFSFTPSTNNLVVAHRLLKNMHPNSDTFKAESYAKFLGEGEENRKRSIEAFIKRLENAEKEGAFKVLSEYPKTYSDKVSLKDNYESEKYKTALQNRRKKATKKPKGKKKS
jgi:hypothetical protein